MKSRFLLALAIIGASALPGRADLYNFNDEYYVASLATFNSIFPGCTGTCYISPGLYQQVQDAAHGGVLVTRLGNGSSVPGEYLQNTTPVKSNELTLFGWSQSLNNGQQVGYVYNSTNPQNGPVLYFQNKTITGGATTPFTFNSFDLRPAGSSGSLSFTLEGFLGGVLEDSAVLNVSGNTFTTFTENWTNVDTVEVVSTAGLPVNWGSGTLFLDNVVLNNATVPEPSSIMLLGSVLLGLTGIIRKRFLPRRPADKQ